MTSAPISASTGPVTTPLGLADLVDAMEERLVQVPVVDEPDPPALHADHGA